MGFEWDPAKNAANRRRHGVGFETAARIFEGPVLERLDDRFDYGEERIAAIGSIQGVEMTVYYTWRQDVRRLISARKASRNERKSYYRALQSQRR